MKTILHTAFALAALGLNTSYAITYSLSGPLDALQAGSNGANEPGGGFGTFDMVIAGAGDGSGTIAGDYDDVTKLLNYTITWQDLTANITNMHFHDAPAGVSGGVDLGIPGPWSSPYVGSAVAVDAAQEANLLAGDWYVNIHTSNFTSGEIRGQVLVAPIPEPASVALAAAAIFSLVGLSRVGLARQRPIDLA